MNSLKHKLSTATLKKGGKVFVASIICMLFSFQIVASSNNNFDLSVDLNIHPATCGEENGAITTTVSGGVPPYLYMWSNGQTSTGIVNLAPGNYSVTVTDNIGNTATASGTIEESPGITISSVIVVEANCGENNGWAIVNVDGNPMDYNFEWFPDTIGIGPIATGLSAGTYSVTITDQSQDDCFLVETFSVGHVEGPEPPLLTTASVCGEDNGSATFDNTQFEYTWDPDLGTPNAEGNIRTDLPSGTYFVTITDPSDPDCYNVKTVVIEEIPSITVDYTINNMPDCGAANGSVTINASGGSGNYHYSWGAQTVDNLSAGVYEVTVTDTNTGCTGSVIFTLLDDSGGVNVVVNDVVIACAGDMDGTVIYTVTYTPGFAHPADTTIQDANGNEYVNGDLPPGDYCVVINDANGCFSGSDCFEIEAPTQIDADLAIVDALCGPNGSITIEITGGAGGYTYEWDPAQNPSGPVASDLPAGIYVVTITDANGCSGVADNLIVDDNCPPDDPPCIISIESVLVIEASCGNNDGYAQVNVAGDPNGDIYNYLWSPNVLNPDGPLASELVAGTYSVTIDDPVTDNCSIVETFTVGNIDGPETDFEVTHTSCHLNDGTVTFAEQSFEYTWEPDLGTPLSNYEWIDLPGGEYFITITDPADPDCKDYLTIVVEEDSPLVVTADIIENPDCDAANGSVTINVAGGSGNYEYIWNGQTLTQTVDNLETGVYEVQVIDNDTGCEGEVLFSLSADNPQAEITISVPDSLSCAGHINGFVEFTVDYQPGFAEPADTLIVDANNNEYSNDTLPAGSYCIIILDANGCQQAGACFEISDPHQIDVDVSIYPAGCDSFGLISLAVTGGVGGYTYDWDPPISAGSSIDDLIPGAYSVTVTDANGCSVGAAQLIVNEDCPCPDIFLESVIVIEASCGNADGFAQVNVDGNPDDFTYDWSSNVTSFNGPQAFNLEAGDYSVTITDTTQTENCFIIEAFTVGNIDGPEVTYTPTPSDCALNNGTVTFSNPNYEYTWSPDLGNGGNSNIRTDLPAGVYFVTVVDPAVPDCPDVLTVVVEQTGGLDVMAEILQNPDCGFDNGVVSINVTGGSGNYIYSWGAQTQDNLAAGVYEVTVTDTDTGCTGSVNFVLLSFNPEATVTINNDPSLNCSGDDDGFVDFTVIYSGNFDFPADTVIQDADGNIYTNGNLPSGSFCIVITDASGCFSGGDCFEIAEPGQIDVDISIYPQDCDSLGSISLVVTGGAGGYVYEWDPPQNPSGPIIDDLVEGTYGLTITDANGCSVDAGNLIVEDICDCPPVIIDGLFILNASCMNNDGFAFISVDGGPGGFIYTWSPNVTNPAGPFALDLAAGTYSVTVADENNPQICYAIETFTVNNDNGPVVTYTSTPSDCGESNGSVTFDSTQYVYEWDPDIGTVVSSYERTDLPAGEYYITATDPADSLCPAVITVIVEELETIIATATINQNPDCNQANGSVTIDVLGGSGDYSFSWGGATVTNLEAGIYVVTVTDNITGCEGVIQFSLTNSNPQAEVIIDSVTEILCPGDEDGTVTYTVNYGPNFEFPDSVVIVDDLGIPHENGFLGPGFYCINVYDASGCLEASECFEIEAPTQINVVVEIEHENCDSLGSIILVDVNGGAGGYTYEWDPPVTTDSFAFNLIPDFYGITVTDANGCSISGEIPILPDSNKITIDRMPDTLICDTSIIIGANITPDSAIVVWTDEDGNPFDPSLPVTPTDTSVYYVEVTSGECFAMDSVVIIEGAVNIEVEYDSISCIGADSTIVITNLDPGDTLIYVWGPDSLIILDGNEHTGTPTINIDTAGDYSIYYDVTNQYGCSVTDTLEILVVDSMMIDTVISTMQCDSLTVDFSVNELPFAIYVWNFGDPGNPGGAIGPNPSHEYSDTGCYTVTLIVLPNTSASCFAQDTIYHEVCVVPPPLFDLGIEVDVDCNDNGAQVTLEDVSTSVLGDIIGWEWTIDGDSVSSDSVVIIDVPESDTLEVDLIVLNEEGCLDTLMEDIPINIIDIEFSDTILACIDDMIQFYNGSDTLWVFEWSPPGIFDDPNDPHAVATVTDDVLVTVSISDTMNMYSCPQLDTIVVIVADSMNLQAQEDPVFCNEDDAPPFVTASCENCDPDMMEWSFEDPDFNTIYGTGPMVENSNDPGGPLMVGMYYVQIIDSLTGCSEMDSVLVIPVDLPLTCSDDQVICAGDTTLIVCNLVSDSSMWIGPNLIPTEESNEVLVYPTEDQLYYYIVTDTATGCSAIDSSLIEVINIGENLTATAEPPEICIYESTQLNVTQIPGATYLWTNEETLDDPTIHNPMANPLEPTTYEVIVTDDETGCAVAALVDVSVVHPACEEPYVFFPNAFTPNGDGHNDELCLRGSDVTDVHFIIYNRWGEKMFESNSQGECWDGRFNGKELGADVYGYYLRVRCGNGEEFIKKGNVTILR